MIPKLCYRYRLPRLLELHIDQELSFVSCLGNLLCDAPGIKPTPAQSPAAHLFPFSSKVPNVRRYSATSTRHCLFRTVTSCLHLWSSKGSGATRHQPGPLDKSLLPFCHQALAETTYQSTESTEGTEERQAGPLHPDWRSLTSTALPHGARLQQIISIQTPAASQGGPRWRNPCVRGTLASNYRVGSEYNVNYSPQEPHSGEQSQTPHAYDTHHHRASLHHASPPALALHELPSHQSHYGVSQHYTTAHRPYPVPTGPAHLAGHPSARHMGHPGPPHYGAVPSPYDVVAPMYSSLIPTHGSTRGLKRPRPDDLDLLAPDMPDLDQSSLGSMHQMPLGAAYAPVVSEPPTHHHHRLPDTSPPAKIMRGDEGRRGGALSMVGQVGMPPPAPRPRGPKLKFTPEDDQLLIDLKENRKLTWKQIADFFPGRSSGTLQVRYCTKLKAKTTQWTGETVRRPRSYCRSRLGGRANRC